LLKKAKTMGMMLERGDDSFYEMPTTKEKQVTTLSLT